MKYAKYILLALLCAHTLTACGMSSESTPTETALSISKKETEDVSKKVFEDFGDFFLLDGIDFTSTKSAVLDFDTREMQDDIKMPGAELSFSIATPRKDNIYTNGYEFVYCFKNDVFYSYRVTKKQPSRNDYELLRNALYLKYGTPPVDESSESIWLIDDVMCHLHIDEDECSIFYTNYYDIGEQN